MVFAGKRLVNHRICTIEVMEKRFCRALCFMEPDCVSINLDKRVDGSGNYKCELNNVTHEGHEHELREEENSFYHAAKVGFPYLYERKHFREKGTRLMIKIVNAELIASIVFSSSRLFVFYIIPRFCK